MVAIEKGVVFLKSTDTSGETKDKNYIADRLEEGLIEIGMHNVVQIVTDNVANCIAVGLILEGRYPHIFWTPCVVHTLNLALKNKCAANNTTRNHTVFSQCGWITEVSNAVNFVKIFITSHQYRLSIFNKYSPLKLLSVADTRFASTIVMLKRMKLLEESLRFVVISRDWNDYRDDNPTATQVVKDTVLNDLWWDKVDYILDFTRPIYDMLRLCDTDKTTLHLVYDKWDSMIERVRAIIDRHEQKEPSESSYFYDVVYDILIDRWTKSCTPLHCMAHSLNPRYYSHAWLSEGPNRVPPHADVEISTERNNCLRRYFPDIEERTLVTSEFAKFSGSLPPFDAFDSLECRASMDPKEWWLIYGVCTPRLQKLALKLLGQLCSSSCCERNWSTYNFIRSMRRNKFTPQRAQDLVYIHTNRRLLSRKSDTYQSGRSKMWDITGDEWDTFAGAGELEIANLSLDEPEIERILTEDDEGLKEIDTSAA